MVYYKEYGCVLCGTVEWQDFRGSCKTLCKHCEVFRSAQTRKLCLLPYDCKTCGAKDSKLFYITYKSKCKKCVCSEKREKRAPKPHIVIKIVSKSKS